MATAFLNLDTTTQAAGSAVTFLAWRLAMNNDTSSNMTKIDTFASESSASITALTSSAIYLANATESTTNNYVAAVSGISAYSTGLMINLSVDVTTTGTTTLNINSLGTKSLYKIQSNGVAGNLTSGDLVAGRSHFFQYTAGGYWLWIDGTSADQINISGTANDIVLISASGITTSGSNLGQLAHSTASYVTYGSASGLPNALVIASGSGTSATKSGSEIKINVVATTPIVSSGSAISHVNSGVSAATYTLSSVTVDATGHITSASSGVIATPTQVTSGSSNTALVSASSLASSNYGKRTVVIPLNQSSALTGTESNYVPIPASMNGWKLIAIDAYCSGSSTSGSPAFLVKSSAVNSSSASQNMLTTNPVIGQGSFYSNGGTGSVAGVVNATYQTVYSDWKIWAYSASASACGTGVTGADVSLTFQNVV